MEIIRRDLTAGDSAVNRTRDIKTPEKSSTPARQVPAETADLPHKRIVQTQRTIARDQLLLGAFEQLKFSLTERSTTTGILAELMSKTLIRGERILEPYGEVLKEAEDDAARLDELIISTRRRIASAFRSLGRDETAIENRHAVSQDIRDLPDLLKRIVGELKNSPETAFHLKREHVLDLLG